MDKVKIMYVINGAVECDVLTGSELSIQRNGSTVHIDFPNADGVYLVRFAKKVDPSKQDPITWVSYAQADWVTRSKVQTDTPAETS